MGRETARERPGGGKNEAFARGRGEPENGRACRRTKPLEAARQRDLSGKTSSAFSERCMFDQSPYDRENAILPGTGRRPRQALQKSRSVGVKDFLICMIYLYRACVAPLFGPCCRFTPSCSVYAEEVLRNKGTFLGLKLLLQRVFKCHPFHPGGFDPAP